MKLQLDSTVMYGLNKFGIIASNAQLQSNSPYNTYKLAGPAAGPDRQPGATPRSRPRCTRRRATGCTS